MGWDGTANAPSEEERTIRSAISFDKGGAWSHLKPPKVGRGVGAATFGPDV